MDATEWNNHCVGYKDASGGHSAVMRAGMFLCAALLLPPLTGCGPLASQLEERASAEASATQAQRPSVVMGTPDTSVTATPSTQRPSATPAPSARVTLAANQAGMTAPVQKACAALLRREASPLAPEAAGECIEQAMIAGGTYRAAIETNGTSLPGGEHQAQVRTSPKVSAVVTGDAGTELRIDGGSGELTGRNGTIVVDPKGGPDERSAAIVMEAAQNVLNPAGLKELFRGAESVTVDYAPQSADAPDAAVRLTSFGVGTIQGVDTVSLELLVDPLYRPLRLVIIGTAQAIPALTSVAYEGWGEQLALPPSS